MSDTQASAWFTFVSTTLVVALLFLRRSLAMRQPGSRYRALEIATLVATALGVGALMGLGAYLIVSGLGR